MEEEVENVEYLDDCATDEVEDNHIFLTLPHTKITNEPPFEVEDGFYPNAIQCLIALYREKYNKEMNTSQEISEMYRCIWEDISKNMRESFFDFNAEQVKQKFTRLRQQYFDVRNKMDIESFEYFQPFHEIYNVSNISTFLNNNHSTAKNNLKDSNGPRSCRDDILFGPPPQHDVREDKQTEEIAHKEQEFIIMMGREHQAIDGANRNELPATTNISTVKHEPQDTDEVKLPTSPPLKRLKVEKVIASHTHTQHLTEMPAKDVRSELRRGNEDDMTLAAYNAAQQRRHEENMDLIRRTISLQERVMEMQIKLLEKIVNRVK
ncbi:uncharacterized protein [Eurosta solidaginis]|uniref:uncharacterized protein n=1 Tax=Eurosta solidaginis TaxID=178769 RepID=UPI003531729E